MAMIISQRQKRETGLNFFKTKINLQHNILVTAVRITCFIVTLFFNCFVSTQDSGRTRELLSATYNLYQSSHVMSGTKRALMMFFSSIAFPENPALSRCVM